LRLQLRLTWLGGTTILNKIQSGGFVMSSAAGRKIGKWGFAQLYSKARVEVVVVGEFEPSGR